MNKIYKLKRLKISNPINTHPSKDSSGRTLNVSTDMRIIADDKYLNEVDEHSRINDVRRKTDEEGSLTYADTHYVRHIS